MSTPLFLRALSMSRQSSIENEPPLVMTILPSLTFQGSVCVFFVSFMDSDFYRFGLMPSERLGEWRVGGIRSRRPLLHPEVSLRHVACRVEPLDHPAGSGDAAFHGGPDGQVGCLLNIPPQDACIGSGRSRGPSPCGSRWCPGARGSRLSCSSPAGGCRTRPCK